MNKELIEATRLLRDLAEHQNGAPLIRHEKEYNKTMHEVWDFLEQQEALQKAKEEQPKDVEEFLRSHKIWDKFQDENSGFYGVAPKTIMNLLTDFANSRKVTDEEIEREANRQFQMSYNARRGFIAGAKWKEKQLNK